MSFRQWVRWGPHRTGKRPAWRGKYHLVAGPDINDVERTMCWRIVGYHEITAFRQYPPWKLRCKMCLSSSSIYPPPADLP